MLYSAPALSYSPLFPFVTAPPPPPFPPSAGADLLARVPRFALPPARPWFPWPRPDVPAVFVTACACHAAPRARGDAATAAADKGAAGPGRGASLEWGSCWDELKSGWAALHA